MSDEPVDPRFVKFVNNICVAVTFITLSQDDSTPRWQFTLKPRGIHLEEVPGKDARTYEELLMVVGDNENGRIEHNIRVSTDELPKHGGKKLVVNRAGEGYKLDQEETGSGSGNSEEIHVDLVGSAIKSMESISANGRSALMKIYNAIPAIDTVTWNKKQCESILHRCNAIVKRLEIMGLNSTSDGPEAPDADLVYHKFHQILKAVLKLVQSYVAKGKITSLVVARLENREAFQELHEELDTLKTMLGFQNLEENVDSTLGTKDLLETNAELDKEHMLKANRA